MTQNYVDWKQPQGEASTECQAAEQVRGKEYFKQLENPQRLQNDCMQQFHRAWSKTSVSIKGAFTAKGKKNTPLTTQALK